MQDFDKSDWNHNSLLKIIYQKNNSLLELKVSINKKKEKKRQ